MARSKFTFEKRQKEIARKKKQEDKAARRADAKRPPEDVALDAEMESEGAAGDSVGDPTTPEPHRKSLEKEE